MRDERQKQARTTQFRPYPPKAVKRKTPPSQFEHLPRTTMEHATPDAVQQTGGGSSRIKQEYLTITAGDQSRAIEDYILQTGEAEELRLKKELAVKQKTLQELNEKLSRQEEQLKKVGEAWKSVDVCGYCREHMQKPFMLRECGHYFCGPCLRRQFYKTLESRLEVIPLPSYGSNIGDTSKVPRSVDHLERTIADLRAKVVDPKTIFHYVCTQCSIIIRKTPLDLSVARTLLCGTKEALEARPDLLAILSSEESDVQGVQFFDGLFLREHNPQDYR